MARLFFILSLVVFSVCGCEDKQERNDKLNQFELLLEGGDVSYTLSYQDTINIFKTYQGYDDSEIIMGFRNSDMKVHIKLAADASEHQREAETIFDELYIKYKIPESLKDQFYELRDIVYRNQSFIENAHLSRHFLVARQKVQATRQDCRQSARPAEKRF